MLTDVLGRYVASSLVSSQAFRRALTAASPVDMQLCGDLKSSPSVA